ncbi:MAG: hypothetical protein CL534_00970 [Ahrensia sp.]|nr:hypothetical protein [Ahrensia sp.]
MAIERDNRTGHPNDVKKQIAAALALALTGLTATPTLAITPQMISSLKQMDPQTRLEQRCDIAALETIARDSKRFKPDKVIAYAFSDPKFDADTVTAKGAAFRSGGEWRRLSYVCKTGPERIELKSFEYTIGDVVPRENWDAHYLVP